MRRVGVGLAAITLLVGASPASASVTAAQPGDHTVTNGPISITVPIGATLQRGTVTNLEDYCGLGPPAVWTGATGTVAWSAHSTAGTIVDYDIYQNTSENGPTYWYTATVPMLTDLVGNYDGSCGGGGDNYGWTIVARDSSGNTVTASVNGYLNVDRYNNYNVNFSPRGTWSYTGSWAVSTCLCADGGAQTYTSTKGASASYTMTATVGMHFALMMAEGPGRGSFKIYQDGVLKGTVNTHASTNLNRMLVWTSTGLTAGPHVFKVVNLASSGHARIDVNAALSD